MRLRLAGLGFIFVNRVVKVGKDTFTLKNHYKGN